MTRTVLQHFRHALTASQEETLEELSRKRKTLEQHIPQVEEIEVVVSTLNLEYDMKNAIEAALERIDKGDYGICESCAQPISLERLNVLPWAALCAACQGAAEFQSSRAA